MVVISDKESRNDSFVTFRLPFLRKNHDIDELRYLKSTSLTGKFDVIIKGKLIYIPGKVNISRIIYYNFLNNYYNKL